MVVMEWSQCRNLNIFSLRMCFGPELCSKNTHVSIVHVKLVHIFRKRAHKEIWLSHFVDLPGPYNRFLSGWGSFSVNHVNTPKSFIFDIQFAYRAHHKAARFFNPISSNGLVYRNSVNISFSIPLVIGAPRSKVAGPSRSETLMLNQLTGIWAIWRKRIGLKNNCKFFSSLWHV